jgi:hypothetical protein
VGTQVLEERGAAMGRSGGGGSRSGGGGLTSGDSSSVKTAAA